MYKEGQFLYQFIFHFCRARLFGICYFLSKSQIQKFEPAWSWTAYLNQLPDSHSLHPPVRRECLSPTWIKFCVAASSLPAGQQVLAQNSNFYFFLQNDKGSNSILGWPPALVFSLPPLGSRPSALGSFPHAICQPGGWGRGSWQPGGRRFCTCKQQLFGCYLFILTQVLTCGRFWLAWCLP